MEITGGWDPKMDVVVRHLFEIVKDLEDGMRALPSPAVKAASSSLYNNVSAVSSTLYKLCRDTRTKCSSQAVGALLRTIIEATIAVFAFCKDPPSRAVLFMRYACVLQFKLQISAMRNIGCPLVSASRYNPARVAPALAMGRRSLLQFGAEYLSKKPGKGKTTQDVLLEAMKRGSERPSWFRDHWFPESRPAVLAWEQMAWVDDVLYKWLCSSVHSDVWAGSPLGGMERTEVAMFAQQFWGSSVVRLSEALGLSLDQNHIRYLRDMFYGPLQWKPGEPGATVI